MEAANRRTIKARYQVLKYFQVDPDVPGCGHGFSLVKFPPPCNLLASYRGGQIIDIDSDGAVAEVTYLNHFPIRLGRA